MERKKALALAGAAAISVAVVGTATAANLGLLRSADAQDGNVGTLTMDGTELLVPGEDVSPETIYLDDVFGEDVPSFRPETDAYEFEGDDD